MTEAEEKVGRSSKKDLSMEEKTFIIGFDCAFYIKINVFSKYFINW